MTAAEDAAVLYFAVNGTKAPLACRHIGDGDGPCGISSIVGVSSDDGSPLCQAHVTHPEEKGHPLSHDTLLEIRALHEKANRTDYTMPLLSWLFHHNLIDGASAQDAVEAFGHAMCFESILQGHVSVEDDYRLRLTKRGLDDVAQSAERR
jgi:hypothetical protein